MSEIFQRTFAFCNIFVILLHCAAQVRGHKSRTHVRLLLHAATVIQAGYRRHLVKSYLWMVHSASSNKITSSPKNACATLDRALGHRAGLEVAGAAAQRWVDIALAIARTRRPVQPWNCPQASLAQATLK